MKKLRYYLRRIVGLSCALMLGSCNRATKPPPTTNQKPVEQSVSDLEKLVNGNAARPSEQKLRQEEEHDLAEIRSMGLVDRAQRDFASRMPGAVIENLRISYFMDTNVVWCSLSYKAQDAGESQNQDFGYKRLNGTNWSLIWDQNKR
jgi:hypothetical protein